MPLRRSCVQTTLSTRSSVISSQSHPANAPSPVASAFNSFATSASLTAFFLHHRQHTQRSSPTKSRKRQSSERNLPWADIGLAGVRFSRRCCQGRHSCERSSQQAPRGYWRNRSPTICFSAFRSMRRSGVEAKLMPSSRVACPYADRLCECMLARLAYQDRACSSSPLL